MLVSYLWLNELVDFDLTPEKLAATLTDLGLETSFYSDRRGWYDGLVIGKVNNVVKHPNADRLSVCEVDTNDRVRKIVCGAPNVEKGQLVVVALPGTTLPNGMKVGKRKVRGEVSDGMVCSESELGLSDDHEGIMILEGTLKIGISFEEAFEVADVVLEVDLTPNRGDCLSMIGIAREVAATTGSNLIRPKLNDLDSCSEKTSDFISIKNNAPDMCSRYVGRAVKNLTVKKSPFWIRRRLHALGIRSINNLVDITNYVLLEVGHPLHAFDSDLIDDNTITVRCAKEKEKFTTLDGKTYTLNPSSLVIADKKGAVALAGIMGGENSEVSKKTRNVILEAAFFDPAVTRRTAKSLNISTEASFRFERGTDIDGLIYAVDRAADLMAQLGGGSILCGRVDKYPKKIQKRKITLRYQRVNLVLGADISKETVKDILVGLGLAVVKLDDFSITVEIPHFRFDLAREIDLVEEIARFVGYNSIESRIPKVPANTSGMGKNLALRRSMRKNLRSIGFTEGMRYSFTSRSETAKLGISEPHDLFKLIALDNPLTSEWTHLRTSLIPGLLSTSGGSDDLQIFEVGTVFKESGKDDPEEKWLVSGVISQSMDPGLWSGRSGKRDFFHLKGIVESLLFNEGIRDTSHTSSSHPFYYPKRQANVLVSGVVVGHFGQIHPFTLEGFDLRQEYFVFEIEIDRLIEVMEKKFFHSSLSKFPGVKRDISIVVGDQVSVQNLDDVIKGSAGDQLRNIILFDVYSGERIGQGKKSMAFALEFGADDRTLTDSEVNTLLKRIVDALESKLEAKLRK
tara:strand:- start:254203 stop:256593 length:2391 start_codon:yes stop_codon:yes gene_type:complete